MKKVLEVEKLFNYLAQYATVETLEGKLSDKDYQRNVMVRTGIVLDFLNFVWDREKVANKESQPPNDLPVISTP